jgi:ADP-heptose:LPS heptosyltransferase
MDDVASLVSACDLVISVPTTVVHLAGALGVPCWAMVHERPTVFYGLEGGLDIWNSVEVFRKNGEWEEVIQRVSDKLSREGI